ncbi:MAG: PIG-L family deacetylase [Spirochaetales bacterium]|jgi:LmbE family N-acetylglucosaminyl deacetylase|nr:PIG-L family deacetylase [Spirochaetales bacterium]
MSKKLKVIAIGAHPDDCEYCFGGSAAKYIQMGHEVCFVSATNGNAGHQTLGRLELAAIRADETKAVSAISGVSYVVLDNDDGNLTDDLETRDELIAVIRRFNPDMIFTHRTNDYHTDHRHTGLLVQDASFLLGVPLVCPSVPCMEHVPVILSFYDAFKKPVAFQADIAVTIDDTMDVKVRMLDCHKSQFYDWLPWIEHESDQLPAAKDDQYRWLNDKMRCKDAAVANCCRTKLVERYGQDAGQQVQVAEAFEFSEYGKSLTAEEMAVYFPF